MPDLQVVNGGKGGAGTPPKFKEHPLAKFLWKAIYPKPAISMKEIANRMSAVAKYKIRASHASGCLYHVRDNAEEYGWTVCHVARGLADKQYFPVLVDGQTVVYSEAKIDIIYAGARSTAKTIRTMAEHEAIALEIVADASKCPAKDKRLLRASSAMLTGAAEMAEKVLLKLAV